MSRGKRATVTFLASAVVTLMGMVLSFVTAPLLLEYLGAERMGVFRIANEYIGYVTLLDFGITGVLQVMLARAVGNRDGVEVAAVVRAGFRISFVFLGVNVFFLLGLMWLIPHLIEDLSAELVGELRLGLFVVLWGNLVFPAIAFRPLADAQQRGYVVQFALIVQAWTAGILSVVFAVMGWGLVGYFLANAIGLALFTTLLVWDGIRQYPQILKPLDRSVAVPVAFSGRLFLFHLLGRIGLNSDGIILGMMTVPTVVAAFTYTQKFAMLAQSQILAMGMATWAGLAEMHHQGRNDLLSARLIQLTRWSGVFAFTLMTPIAAFTGPFVSLWVGPEQFGGDALAWTTAAYVWLQTLAALWGWPLVTTGRIREVLPIYLIGIPLNVAVSVWGTSKYGMIGPTIGSLSSIALVWMWWMPLLLRSVFGVSLRALADAVIRPALFGVPYALALGVLASYVSPTSEYLPKWVNWISLAGVMAAAALGYLTLAWLFVLPKEDRAEFWLRVLRR